MKNGLINQMKAKLTDKLNLKLSRTARFKTSLISPAFTIIELLVVIAIIAILAALIFVAYPAVVKSALQATMQSSLSTSYRAITSFQSMNDRLPTSISDCDSSTSTTAKNAGYSSNDATTLCIKPGNNFTYVYTYDNNSTPQTFTLYAKSTTSSNQNLAYKVSSSNSNPIASTNGKTCPNNFILVPGSSTPGYRPDDFCVSKYEMKIYGNDNGKQGYSNTNLPNSRPGGTPYVLISQTNLMPTGGDNMATKTVDGQKQQIAGAHLITEAEWMTIAQNVLSQPSNWSSGIIGTGYIYSGHNNYSPSNYLTADVNDNNGYVGTNNTSGNQRRTLTLSNGEVVWDLSGNAQEWTSGQITGHQPGLSSDSGYVWRNWKDATSQNGFPTSSMPTSMASGSLTNITSLTTSSGIGALASNYNDTAIRGILRGGSNGDFSNAGVLCLNLNVASSASSVSVGFRVVVPAS